MKNDMDDRYYMAEALSFAEKGYGFTSPNPMVGAIVVKDDNIVGRGWHKKAGGPHAEVFALDEAGELAKGATIYVTLEPCNHTGKTPPCSKKIVAAGIKRVVIAMKDPNPVAMGGIAYLEANGIDVVTGICEDDAKKLNEVFIYNVIHKKPFVFVKYASTLDGRLATRTGHSKWITSAESRQAVHMLRHWADGIVVGVGTVIADDPSLTTRYEAFEGIDPHRIILDSTLKMPETAKLLRLESDSDTFVVSGKIDEWEADAGRRKRLLTDKGVKIIELPLQHGRIDLKSCMMALHEKGLTNIMIEGGGRVIGSAFRAGIVNKVYAFYGPKLLGGSDGTPVCAGDGPEKMTDAIALGRINVHQFGSDIMVEGYVE